MQQSDFRPEAHGHYRIYGYALTAIFLLIVLAILNLSSVDKWIGNAMTAVVGVAAILGAAEFPKRADERARRANSIEIARRWDQEPFLWSRGITRELSANELAQKVRDNDPNAKVAMIHMSNYYWEIAEAVDSLWADELYIRERFRETLIDFYPAILELLRASPKDPSALVCLTRITKLHLDWTKQMSGPSPDQSKGRINSMLSDLNEAMDQSNPLFAGRRYEVFSPTDKHS